MKSNPSVKQIILAPLAVVGVLLMLLEEHIWDWLVALGQWASRLPILQRIEHRIGGLPPSQAAMALFTPVIMILPIKFLAVWIMSTGDWGLGLMVLIGAKLLGTVLVARIYTLCDPALSTLPWFVTLRQRFIQAKNWAHRRLNSWYIWRYIRRSLYKLRRKIASLIPRPSL
jgi:hypothetical protein